jgi:hypothetical protein
MCLYAGLSLFRNAPYRLGANLEISPSCQDFSFGYSNGNGEEKTYAEHLLQKS